MARDLDRSVVVGVDLGTSNIKAIAHDAGGTEHAEATRENFTRVSETARAEQDPDAILESVLECVSEVAQQLHRANRPVAGLCLSSAMHSLIALDAAGRRLTPSIIWADNRAVEQVKRLKRDFDEKALYERTGTPVHPMSPFAKLLWFRERDRETFERAAQWISIKEYLLRYLTGEGVVDHSIASATGLFNTERLEWDDQSLSLVSVSERQLAEPVAPSTVLTLSSHAGARLGLDPATPVVVGASDGALGNLGLDVLGTDAVACSIGTSGAVRTTVVEAITDPLCRLFCYVMTGGRYIVGGATSSGGLALKWLLDRLFYDLKATASATGADPFELLDDLAAAAPTGNDGVIFLPYLAGERAPFWNPDVTGGFYGLTVKHGREHMVRGVLEGVIFHLYRVVEALQETCGETTEFRATGGFARSSMWPQIMADVFRTRIVIPHRREAVCWGASRLGFDALGIAEPPRPSEDGDAAARTYEPVPANVRIYEDRMGDFAELYDQLH